MFAIVGLFFLVWRSGKQSNGLICRIGAWMRTHRIAAAICVFLLLALNTAIALGAEVLTVKSMSMPIYGVLMEWRRSAALLPILFWPFVLAWLLQRITRKTIIR
jgi:hypothetical protein